MKNLLRALVVFVVALSAYQSASAESHRETWEAHQAKAEKAIAEKRYLEAESHLKEALRYTNGRDGARLRIRTLEDLGLLYLEMERLDGALDAYDRALKLYAPGAIDDHTTILNSLTRLALLLERQGRTADAERLLVSALGIEQAYGSETEQSAHRVTELARFYHRRRAYANADQRYDQAFQLYNQLPSPQREQFTRSLRANQARLALDRGNLGEAEDRFRDLLADLNDKTDTVTTIEVLRDYARLMRETGRNTDADTMEREAARLEDRVP